MSEECNDVKNTMRQLNVRTNLCVYTPGSVTSSPY